MQTSTCAWSSTDKAAAHPHRGALFCLLQRLMRMALVISALLLWAFEARAQTANTETPLTHGQQQALRASLNNGSLLVVAGRADSAHFAMANDIAAVLAIGEDVRLLPIAGRGGIDRLRDLVFLRGVDLAIVPANVLTHMKAIEAEIGAAVVQRIAYVTYLYGEEVHLLVGEGISTIESLHRRRVAVPLDDDNALFTAHDLFDGHGAGVEVEIVRLRLPQALEDVRSGRLAGILLVGGKPLPIVSGLPKDGRLRLLGLPFSPTLEQGYSPAVLEAEDYPTLIPPGTTVRTVAVSALLMANSGRGAEESARRLAKFVPHFFGSAADLTLGGRNPKWKELNIAAPLPGWSRLPVAQEWLRNAREEQKTNLQKQFEAFLRSSRQPGAPELTPAQRKKLFDEFVDWTRGSVGAVGSPVQR